MSGVAQAVSASSLSEICWVGAAGRPRVRGVVTLVRDTTPVLAFTYADEPAARCLASARRVTLALTEPRSTGRAFTTLSVEATPRLVEDPDGDLFIGALLEQELRRYPPARLYADSPLLMREHWWYLPRLLVELDVRSAQPAPPRAGPDDHLLVVAHDGAPQVRVATLVRRQPEHLVLDVRGAPVPAGPAELFGQDASFPDLERWSQWRYTGAWDGDRFAVAEAPGRTGLGPAPGLVQRWRRQRLLERRCIEAIPRP
jgi:hypothetical protein